MKGEIIIKKFLYHSLNMFISAVKVEFSPTFTSYKLSIEGRQLSFVNMEKSSDNLQWTVMQLCSFYSF